MVGWCRRVVVRRTAATATTRSTSPPAARRCRPQAVRCIPRCGSHRCPPPRPRTGRLGRRRRVLFLCTGNSARSQIAEALLERMSAGAIEAASAGSHPKPLHPNAVRVLQQAWHRHQREPHQAPRRVRLPAVRHGDHAVRPRSRSLSRVPVPPRARALERSRPGARGSDQPCVVPGVRTHRRRARRRASASGSTC